MQIQITWDDTAGVYEAWKSVDGTHWDWVGCADSYSEAKAIAQRA